jgi:hypothetical protein
VLIKASEQLGVMLTHRAGSLCRAAPTSTSTVWPDDPLTYVEAFARHDAAEGGQVHKVKGNPLKLIMLRQSQRFHRVPPRGRLRDMDLRDTARARSS